jgi:hypothetical protein
MHPHSQSVVVTVIGYEIYGRKSQFDGKTKSRAGGLHTESVTVSVAVVYVGSAMWKQSKDKPIKLTVELSVTVTVSVTVHVLET